MDNMMTKHSLITKLHAKKAITTSDAIKITRFMQRHENVQALLIHCVKNYDVEYKDFPEEFQNDADFLVDLVKAQPEMLEVIKAQNVKIFRKVNKNLTIAEKKEIKEALAKAKAQQSQI